MEEGNAEATPTARPRERAICSSLSSALEVCDAERTLSMTRSALMTGAPSAAPTSVAADWLTVLSHHPGVACRPAKDPFEIFDVGQFIAIDKEGARPRVGVGISKRLQRKLQQDFMAPAACFANPAVQAAAVGREGQCDIGRQVLHRPLGAGLANTKTANDQDNARESICRSGICRPRIGIQRPQAIGANDRKQPEFGFFNKSLDRRSRRADCLWRPRPWQRGNINRQSGCGSRLT